MDKKVMVKMNQIMAATLVKSFSVSLWVCR